MTERNKKPSKPGDGNASDPPSLRTFRILEILSQSSGPMKASEIQRACGLPKPSVHRLCNAMEAAGLLVREPGRRLRPGRRARHMASGILATGHGLVARHQTLARLAEEIGETVNLVVAQDQGMFYIDRVETNWPMRVQLPIGTHVPFHCTASGKVFLSSLSQLVRERLVATLDLERLTPNTITSQEMLLEELSQVRARGYAIDNEEFIEGMAAVAVPVREPGSAFFAAVAVHGPTRRFSTAAAVAAKDLLLATAARLETVLF